MGQRSIKNGPELAKAIKLRRNELNLTIEEAAAKAGVGTKTWSRYEAGEAIRKDKGRGICKALSWKILPCEKTDTDEMSELELYENHEAWSEYLAEQFGKRAAISFVVGSDILFDELRENMDALASMPAGSHVGQIDNSFLQTVLPEQFIMKYDYDFVYAMYTTLIYLRNVVKNGNQIIAHSVMEELVLYLIVEESKFLVECMDLDAEEDDLETDTNWDEWIFDIFDDMDLITCLYSDMYLTVDHIYHFDHWLERQFYC